MQASAGNMANFTGVLIQRQYKPGQKYIQLVFETAEGIHLSLSRNLRMVRSLSIGRTYNVRGQEYSLGKKTYIHDPIATPITGPLPKTRFFNNRLRLIIIGMIVISLAGASVAALAVTQDSDGASIQNKTVQKQKVEAPASSNAVVTPVSDDKPDSPAPVTKVTKKPSTVKAAQITTPAALAPAQQQSSDGSSSDTPIPAADIPEPINDAPVITDPPQEEPAPTDIPTESP